MADGVEVLGERLTKPVATIRLGPLLVTGALGLALVVAHIVVELEGDAPALSGLMLEVGAGLLLFAVLLVVQNRLVERAISAARGLTPDELVSKQAEGEANPLTPGDFHADLGPLAVAGAVVRDLADGAFRDAWLLFDPNLRRCRAMAWLYNNRAQLGLPEQFSAEAEELVDVLMELRDHPSGLADHFIEIEARQYAEGLAGYNDDLYGWSQRRRIVGPMHEMVLAIRLPSDAPHGILVDRPTIVSDTIKVLVSAHVVSDRVLYLVAGINYEAAPLPTWPPTWWAIDDPVAAAAHPGIAARPVEGGR
tara:strand:+ start:202 stop:1122 length:921 start_codon:yes stop_codon:yes gene_type:complete